MGCDSSPRYCIYASHRATTHLRLLPFIYYKRKSRNEWINYKVKRTTGLGLNQNELYVRAFEKGVLLNKFQDAADTFDKAAKKFTESGEQMMATQAIANGLLYRYL